MHNVHKNHSTMFVGFAHYIVPWNMVLCNHSKRNTQYKGGHKHDTLQHTLSGQEKRPFLGSHRQGVRRLRQYGRQRLPHLEKPEMKSSWPITACLPSSARPAQSLNFNKIPPRRSRGQKGKYHGSLLRKWSRCWYRFEERKNVWGCIKDYPGLRTAHGTSTLDTKGHIHL